MRSFIPLMLAVAIGVPTIAGAVPTAAQRCEADVERSRAAISS